MMPRSGDGADSMAIPRGQVYSEQSVDSWCFPQNGRLELHPWDEWTVKAAKGTKADEVRTSNTPHTWVSYRLT